MNRQTAFFSIVDINTFKQKVLNWANSRFSTFCFLDNNQYQFQDPAFDFKLGIAGKHLLQFKEHPVSYQQLQSFHNDHQDWLFGHIGYPSANPDATGFPAAFFFQPEIIITAQNNTIIIESLSTDPQTILSDIAHEIKEESSVTSKNIHLSSRTSREDYISIINKLLHHIQQGDCYEINFCQEFFAEHIQLDPVEIYTRLVKLSPNPFAAFYKINDCYCLCASPERFIKKTKTSILSQPIKGTIPRILHNEEYDQKQRLELLNSPKEKSENVMIVDLVRNDLSKIAKQGSVHVSELFGIYSFPQVHQMISTIEAEIDEHTPWTNVIEACFPMGSMTGAPKKKVMELIEEYEPVPRGLFSGSIGYISPDGDFDFNVVIRSLLYNATLEFVSCKVGSGITINSNPEKEYEECLVKIEAIRSLLQSSMNEEK